MESTTTVFIVNSCLFRQKTSQVGIIGHRKEFFGVKRWIFYTFRKVFFWRKKSEFEDDNTHKLALFREKLEVVGVKSAHLKALNKFFSAGNVCL